MVWAYIFAWLTAKIFKVKFYIPIILLLGVLPDIDLLFTGLGVKHHSFTHSILFWLILFAPLYPILKRQVLPNLIAVIQHFVFSDYIVGSVMLFWPVSRDLFGLNYQMGLTTDVALELIGMLLTAVLIILNGDLKKMLSPRRENMYMIIPLLALFTSMLFFAVDLPFLPLIAYIWSRKLLTILVTGHLVLLAFLAASTIQGLRKSIRDLK